jgi:hypothetical protein
VAWGVAIQPDGKIVVVGQSEFRGFTGVRYNSNGSGDTTFDGDGIVFTSQMEALISLPVNTKFQTEAIFRFVSKAVS